MGFCRAGDFIRGELNACRQLAQSMSMPQHVAELNGLTNEESGGLLLYAEAIHSMPQPSQHHLRQGGAVCKTKQKPDGTGGHADAVGGLANQQPRRTESVKP